ncbi:FAD/NAD(P)-binding protein [Paludibacterium purpuratum]|uniref:Putative NAD(P)/FAD-binding protein YdhS n=1 Tax=Paludibacterium purpuratum TaxID=1144873 RepID=A0A4R7B274_9NEIS|nr:FAD/NAD(P)-binding protein [Paludibacterium purpuratum]TDR73896.1 putative NAD(P)/FAD-binding protein YdhS [Paludibacterium purpuratum]
MFDLAIVGFGATGVSLLKQIQDEVYASGAKTPRIALFSPCADFARGQAFGDADAVHKVNTPPSMLSISNSEPAGFAHWMNAKGNANELYPNRLMYSDFLQETYRDIISSGWLEIEEFRETVQAVKADTLGYQVHCESGQTVSAHKVMLCLGSLHGTPFKQLSALPGFIDHHSEFAKAKGEPVLVAGSGLTAVDAFRSLNHEKNNEIHLFSRQGFAPTCLTKENRYTPKVLNWGTLLKEQHGSVRLQHFLETLKQECELLSDGGERVPAMQILRGLGPARYFEYLMERSQAADLPYQDILVSTRPYMHKLWRSMPIADRISFNINYGAGWAAWRHPIPYEVIAELAEAAREQRLHIHRGHKPPYWENGQFVLESTSGKTIRARYLVDGTGGSNRLDAIDSPLLRNLNAQKLIEAHPCGGIDIHPLTFQCQVDGKPVPGLYSLGPLNKGSLFSTNAFWFNARCAGHWARQWAIEMTKKNSVGI